MTTENSDSHTSGRVDEESESQSVYLRFRAIFGDGSSRSSDARKRAKREPGATVPFASGRDPEPLSSVVDALTTKLGWNSPLARSELLASWQEVAGAETAEHSTPAGIEDGQLTVRCDSTAWATQLRLMRSAVLGRITSRYPDAGITQVRFVGPNVPSWKRGPRSIPGRGPRDTYG
jgi:predicted nucleic acid-binding Zn ribbon protein